MHNSPAVSSAKSFDLTSTAFLIVAFLTGIAGALQTPTLSIFLTDEVHARPAMVGFFFTGSAVIGILVSQFLAGRSDKRGDRKSLIVFCCLLGVLACTLFAWNRNYFVLLFVGVFLSSFGSTANPQMFALAREHADKTGREAVMFSSFLRAQVSLAWVIGPPLAYALAMGFSFTVMYLSAAVAFIVCGGMGDTLAGMITGFLVQFASVDSYKAVTVAVWLHSAIADDLAKNAYVVLPTHISKAIPSWMKKLSL